MLPCQAGAPWFHVDMESFDDFVEDVAEEHDAGAKGNLFLAERRLKVEISSGTEWPWVANGSRWFPARKYLILYYYMILYVLL